MKKVFVHRKNNLWVVIDFVSGKKIESVDDVLLFNAVYFTYKTYKGWVGIVSEHINHDVIDILYYREFKPLEFIKGKKYPRAVGNPDIVKEGAYLHLVNDQTFISSGFISFTRMEILCKHFKEIEDAI
jgi:hypothetical protein